MVGVLLDTCVLSELQRAQGGRQVRARVQEFDEEQLFISVLSVGELVKGVALLPQGERKQMLASILLRLEHRFSRKILPVYVEVARRWGEITAKAQDRGIVIPATDGLIAATALRHGLHLMTRNARHFVATGATLIDPWES